MSAMLTKTFTALVRLLPRLTCVVPWGCLICSEEDIQTGKGCTASMALFACHYVSSETICIGMDGGGVVMSHMCNCVHAITQFLLPDPQ